MTPQGGKGPCDRKAATIKAHVRRFINEGHDVQTARDLEAAMLSAGGLSGQPSTQAFSSRSHDLSPNFVTSPSGIPHSVTSRHFAPSRVA